MMAGFDLHGELFSDNERGIRKVIEQIDALQDKDTIEPGELQDLRRKLLETQGIVRQAESSVSHRIELEEAATLRRESLEQRLAKLQQDYERVLEGKLNSADVEAVKSQLSEAYDNRQSSEAERISELSEDLARRTEETKQLKDEMDELQQRIKTGIVSANGLANGGADSKTVSQQIAEFDQMKKSLMRDLQNRCERVSHSVWKYVKIGTNMFDQGCRIGNIPR